MVIPITKERIHSTSHYGLIFNFFDWLTAKERLDIWLRFIKLGRDDEANAVAESAVKAGDVDEKRDASS